MGTLYLDFLIPRWTGGYDLGIMYRLFWKVRLGGDEASANASLRVGIGCFRLVLLPFSIQVCGIDPNTVGLLFQVLTFAFLFKVGT